MQWGWKFTVSPSRSHIGSSHILFERAYVFFFASRAFLVCLVQVSATEFCCLPLAFMAFDDAEHPNVPNSPIQDLQTLVLLMVLFPTSNEWVLAPQVQWRRDSRPSWQENFRSSRHISWRWHRFPRPCRDSPDSKTVSCRSHNQWQPLHTRLRVLNKWLCYRSSCRRLGSLSFKRFRLGKILALNWTG